MTTPMTTLVPIDYTNLDYDSFREAMFANAATPGAAGYLPQWTARGQGDFGVALVEGFAYNADILAYYIDRVANESFIQTAVLANSVRNKARMLDYRPDNGTAAQVTLLFSVVPGTGSVTIPAGTQVTTSPDDSTVTDCNPLVFETDSALTIAQNSSTNATGTVTATEGSTVTDEALGSSTGQASQVFLLASTPVIEGSIIVLVDEGFGPNPWIFVDHLVTARSTDRVFTTYNVGIDSTVIQFGDGVNGRIPLISSPVTATYRVGGGVDGNSVTTTSSLTLVAGDVTSVVSVAATVSAAGGSDPESIDSIRVNAPKSLSTGHRAVSLVDYANVVLGVSGVAKAVALGTSYTSIRVFVLGANAAALNSTTKALVLSYMQNWKMANANVSLIDGAVVPVNVSCSVTVLSSYNQAAVKNNVTNAIKALFAFSNVNFGQRVAVSDVYTAINSVEGVDFATLTVLSTTTGVADVVMAPFQIPVLGTLALTMSGGVTGTTFADPASILPGIPVAPTITGQTCPAGTGYAGAFHMQVDWPVVTNATSYGVILDFYNTGAVYLGTVNGGTFTTNTATLDLAFVSTTATSVHVKIRAINGANIVDGPSTNVSYTCGTNTP